MGKAEGGGKKAAARKSSTGSSFASKKKATATKKAAGGATTRESTKATKSSPKTKSTAVTSRKASATEADATRVRANKPIAAAPRVEETIPPSVSVQPTESVPAEPPVDKPEVEHPAPEGDDVLLPTIHGKVLVFGGPRDRGVKADDKLALPTGRHFVYERVHSLDPKSFYCMMRWNYGVSGKSPEEGKRWWANKKIVVTNPASGTACVLRAVDYGPHENTGCDIGISPGAAAALGVQPGDEVHISFGDQKAPLGVIR